MIIVNSKQNKNNIYGVVAIPNPLVTDDILKYWNSGATIIKYPNDAGSKVIWRSKTPFTLYYTTGYVNVWTTHQEAYDTTAFCC